MDRVLLLTGPRHYLKVLPIFAHHDIEPLHVERADQLPDIAPGYVLIGYNTGVIVPAQLLASLKKAYNFHGGTPAYPGRDPHHWAIHDGAAEFGVTVHEMTERVDEGRIVAIGRYFVKEDDTPQTLRQRSEGMALEMLNELLPELYAGKARPLMERWSGQKETRADSVAMRGRRGFDGF